MSRRANPLAELKRYVEASYAERHANDPKPEFGAFLWRGDGRYHRADAVRIFKRKGDAERFVNANKVRELVVRTIT